jgi:glycosyltransferase involved in cell wall biosynthesis
LTRLLIGFFLARNKKIRGLKRLIGDNYLLAHQDPSLALVLKDLFKVKIIYDIHGLSFAQDLGNSAVYSIKKNLLETFSKAEEKLIWKKADFLNSPSEELSELISRQFFVNSDKFIVIKDGTFVEEKKTILPANFSELRNKIDGRYVVYFVGNFKAMGGVENLVNAYARLDRKKFFLLIIGSGHLEDIVLKTLHQDNSYYMRSIPFEEVRAYQNVADVLVCPELEDNLYNQVCPSSLKMYGNLLSGKIVLSTFFPFWQSLKETYPKNLFFCESTVDSLESNIIQLSKQKSAPERITDNFIRDVSWEYISYKMVTHYKKQGIL